MSKELNLLPQIYNEGKGAKKKKQNTMLIIAGVTFIVVLGVGYVFGKQVYLEYEKERLVEEVNRNKEMVENHKKLISEISLTKSHIEKAKGLEALKSKSTDKLLNDFSNNIPSSVVLSNLNYTKTTIVASGDAPSINDIEVLWANFRGTEQFNNSYITIISESNGRYSFNLEITLGGEEVNG